MSETNEHEAISWAASSDGPAFTDDVTLEASVLREPVHGGQVKAVMAAAAAYYAQLDFTHQTTDRLRTYMEWEATGHSGDALAGITVLTRTSDGLISHVAIHHRPLTAVIDFSQHLRRSLAGVVPESHFLTD